MPIECVIDTERRIVYAAARGTLTDEDVFGYQREVWSRPELQGYDELIDMRHVEHIELPSSRRVWDLAALSASMDSPEHETKLAIVATDSMAYGLGRMYEVYRELNERSTKKVAVFRSVQDASLWLESRYLPQNTNDGG
jgi:hypothetical protein